MNLRTEKEVLIHELNRANKLCEEASLNYLNMCKRVEVLEKCINEIEEITRTLGNQNDVKCRLNDRDIQKLLEINDDFLTCEEILRKHILKSIKEVKRNE